MQDNLCRLHAGSKAPFKLKLNLGQAIKHVHSFFVERDVPICVVSLHVCVWLVGFACMRVIAVRNPSLQACNELVNVSKLTGVVYAVEPMIDHR
jgi:hypothetical protein